MSRRSTRLGQRDGVSRVYPERPDEAPGALDAACVSLWSRIAPWFERSSGKLRCAVKAVESCEAQYTPLSDAVLRGAVDDLRMRFAREGLWADPIVASLALLREMSRRRTGLRPHAVQIMGALALLDGKLAEMKTGEGKTLVAALAAGTAALAGIPTHVITVNDYLAERDADLARPLLEAVGLSVGTIQHEQGPGERRRHYGCDVTYVSNKEVTFDYLRDRQAFGRRERKRSGEIVIEPVLRGLCFAIVDEADSILVDDARIPLILARQDESPEASETYRIAVDVAARMVDPVHFTVTERDKQVHMTPAGCAFVEQVLEARTGLWRARSAREDLIRHALAARHLYRRDRDYVVHADAVQIVDEHTGRIAAGRRWQHGLHQMIELLEDVVTTQGQTTQASITYQSFFRRYLKLAGMSGTLCEVAAETRDVYGLKTVRILTHRPIDRRDLGTHLVADQTAKWDAVVRSASIIAGTGRPILIGTRSVASSERLSARLTAAGLAHVVLNARHDRDEAEIIHRAGEAGRITVATNMAGRGTDIRPEARAIGAGGLHVILTELHESRRIDRQLIGRGGRQGDPSSYETFVSFEDEVFEAYAPTWTSTFRRYSGGVAVARPAMAIWLRWWAQQAAERHHRRIRQNVFRSRLQVETMLSFAARP